MGKIGFRNGFLKGTDSPLFDPERNYIGWGINKFTKTTQSPEFRPTSLLINSIARVGLTDIDSGDKYLIDGYVVLGQFNVHIDGDDFVKDIYSPIFVQVSRILKMHIEDCEIEDGDEDVEIPVGHKASDYILRTTDYVTTDFTNPLLLEVEPEDILDELYPAIKRSEQLIRIR